MFLEGGGFTVSRRGRHGGSFTTIPNGRICNGGNITGFSWTLSESVVPRRVTTPNADQLMCTTWDDRLVSVDIIPSSTTLQRPVTFSSDNTGVATVNSVGSVTQVAEGDVNITANDGVVSSSIELTLNTPTTVVAGHGGAVGSLREHLTAQIDDRLVGKTPSTSIPIFTTKGNGSGGWTRNSDCWLNGIDLTCMSPYNSYSGYNRAGTLISPRHFVYAHHYTFPVGTTLIFVDNNSNVVTRTMTAQLEIDGSDCEIGVLDSDVPSSISFARVLPKNYAAYLPTNVTGIPFIATNQYKQALVHIGEDATDVISFTQPVSLLELPFYANVIPGDSGSPAFALVNTLVTILNCWLGGYGGAGPFITYLYDDINTAMNSLGGGYRLTDIDLSTFNKY